LYAIGCQEAISSPGGFRCLLGPTGVNNGLIHRRGQDTTPDVDWYSYRSLGVTRITSWRNYLSQVYITLFREMPTPFEFAMHGFLSVTKLTVLRVGMSMVSFLCAKSQALSLDGIV
jgi:hypothetical protein